MLLSLDDVSLLFQPCAPSHVIKSSEFLRRIHPEWIFDSPNSIISLIPRPHGHNCSNSETLLACLLRVIARSTLHKYSMCADCRHTSVVYEYLIAPYYKCLIYTIRATCKAFKWQQTAVVVFFSLQRFPSSTSSMNGAKVSQISIKNSNFPFIIHGEKYFG